MLAAGIRRFFVKTCWKTEDCPHTREPTANYLTLRLLLKNLKQGTMFKNTSHDVRDLNFYTKSSRSFAVH